MGDLVISVYSSFFFFFLCPSYNYPMLACVYVEGERCATYVFLEDESMSLGPLRSHNRIFYWIWKWEIVAKQSYSPIVAC
jgi:hypothetical protein